MTQSSQGDKSLQSPRSLQSIQSFQSSQSLQSLDSVMPSNTSSMLPGDVALFDRSGAQVGRGCPRNTFLEFYPLQDARVTGRPRAHSAPRLSYEGSVDESVTISVSEST